MLSVVTTCDKFICCICKKDFPSKKSLYGHMRSHSAANRKGIHPSTSMEENKSYDHLNVGVAPDEEPKPKRLKMQPILHRTTDKDEEIVYGEEEIIAAQILVSMSHDTWPCDVPFPRIKNNEKGVSNSVVVEDIPSTSGVKVQVSQPKVRRLIVKLKNPYI
uniref:C2H2-type domain-containing protein n=1 Tax=Cajanus cajan TaxID=3821 RepID=A0A151QZH3_CAJCA|nr:hypothetical protein KK1_043320 [Cajanus cajan]